MFLKRLVIILFIFCFNSGYTQTWEQLESEYNTLLNNKKNDSALIKSKEMYSWVKVNEGDTSLNLPISLKFIGNAFININKDSALHYYDLGLNILNKQKRENNIQVSKILYDKATIYYDLKNDSIALIFDLKEIEVLKKLNFPEYPFCIWAIKRVGNLYYKMGDYKKAEPYLLQLLDIRKKVVVEDSSDYSNILNNLGLLYLNTGDYKKAEPYFIQALSIQKKVLGEENPDYAVILNNLGLLYSNMGDYKKAEPFYLHALAIRKKVLGEEHPDYADCINNLGNLYFDMGDYKITETYFLQTLAIRKKVLGDEHPDYAVILNNLGLLYSKMGDYKKAEPYYLKALAIKKIALGEEHPKCASSLNTLGNLYSKMGDYKKAEPYFLQYLAIIMKAFGLENPAYGSSIANLGDLYFKMGDYEKAEPYFLQYLSIQKKILGDEHTNYANTLMNLGFLYFEIGDYIKTESYYLQAFYIQKKIHKKAHPDYLKILINLGDFYLKLAEYKKAEPYLIQYMDNKKEVFGEENTDYAEILNYLGLLYTKMEDYTKAEPYLLNSLAIKKKMLGDEHTSFAKTLSNLGILNYEKGDYKKAETYFLQSLSISKKTDGEEHPDYAQILMNLGLVYAKMGQYKNAEPFYLQALDIKKKTLRKGHPDYIIFLINLGAFYLEIGDYKKGESYNLQSLAISKKTLGEDHPYYVSILTNLGYLYNEMGDYKKAEPYLLNSLAINKKIHGDEHTYNTNNLTNLGLLYVKIGDYKKAETYFLQSLSISKKKYGEEHPDYASILMNLGYLYNEMGDYKNAEYYFNICFDLHKKIINKNFAWLSEKEKEAYWKKENWFYFGLNSISARNNLKSSSSNSLAFNANLISKSLLLETSTNLDKALANSKDIGVKNNFEQLKATRRLYTKLESEGTDKIDLLKKLNLEADSLDKILVNSLDEFRAIKDRFSINWQSIQFNLSSDEAAIEFARYYNDSDSAYQYMALIVRQGDKYPQLIKLCSEYELKQNSPETELNVIYDLVWKPLLPSLSNIKTIYYSPSGLLNNIPFQALFKEENGIREYVMDKFSLHQLTSTRYLALGLKQKEQEPIESSIALFGGINYNDYPNAIADTTNHNESSEAAFLYKNAIVQNRNLDSTRTGAKYLPGTKKEVETIANVLNAKQWNIDISEGKNATENKLKSLSGNNSKAILHIATHGFAFPDKEEKRKDLAFAMMSGNNKYKAFDNPMIRSGLLFGGANLTWQGNGDSLLNTTNEDGVLTAYELSQLDLSKTKLAVLSACETGKGSIQGSEGTFGLRRALKLAGVDNMIVSLWKVPDDATMEMMTLFYTELAKTKLPVPAFELAQKTMRNKYLNEPKKWAGFVFVR